MTLELMILIVNILLFPNGDIFSNKNLYTTSPPSSLLPIKSAITHQFYSLDLAINIVNRHVIGH